MEMFAVPPKDRHVPYVSVPAIRQNIESPCLLCVPSPPMISSSFRAFDVYATRFGQLLLETGMTGLTTMSFVCIARAAEYGVAVFFLPARLRMLTKCSSLCRNEEVWVLVPSEVRADVLERGLSRLLSDCTVD